MEGADNNDGLCAQGLFFFPPLSRRHYFRVSHFGSEHGLIFLYFLYFKKKKIGGIVKSNVSDIIFPNEMKCSSLVAALTRNLATSPIESLLLKTI